MTNRVVQLNLGNASVSKKLTTSSPQGARLSPFLRNIDMVDTLTIDYDTSTSTQAFADDSQLCIILSDNLSELESSANVCLYQLETRTSLKKMNFSPDKSKAVIYTRKRGNLADINIIFKNESIAVTKCEPLPGLTSRLKVKLENTYFKTISKM